MMGSTCFFISAVFLMNVILAGATQRCNAVSFAFQGVIPCDLSWWSSTDFSREINFSPNLTSLVSSSLTKFGLSVSVIDYALGQTLNGSATLSKQLESAGALVPYLVFIFSDLVRGFNLTNEELGKLGLPGHLNDISVLQSLYLNYFSLSCSNFLLPLKSCIASWARSNCDVKLDGIEFVLEAIDEVTIYYCQGNSTKVSAKDFLGGSLGLVFAPVARYFGVLKDTTSPIVFNLSASSIFFRKDKLEQLGASFSKNCGHMLTGFLTFESLIIVNSTVGVGKTANRMMDLAQKLAKCSMLTWNQFDASFFRSYSKFMDHMNFWLASFGIGELSWLPGSFSKGRQTAAVFGANHMRTFNDANPVTCPTGQSSSLLQNRFFTLTSVNTPVSGGSYISQVYLAFLRKSNSAIYYVTGKGPISTQLTNQTATVNIEALPKGVVRITDRVSGTVFVLSKFEESYLVFIRAGEEVHETSVGSLDKECLQRINIWGVIGQAPQALKSRCQKGCAKAPKELIKNCVYDCIEMNNEKVVGLYMSLSELRRAVTAKDSFIASILP